MSCPSECHESIQELYRLSWPGWTRAVLISLIGFLFMSVAWVHLNATALYVTKEDSKETRQELKQDIKEIKGMVEQLLARRAP